MNDQEDDSALKPRGEWYRTKVGKAALIAFVAAFPLFGILRSHDWELSEAVFEYGGVVATIGVFVALGLGFAWLQVKHDEGSRFAGALILSILLLVFAGYAATYVLR
jgi:hypothetical protein